MLNLQAFKSFTRLVSFHQGTPTRGYCQIFLNFSHPVGTNLIASHLVRGPKPQRARAEDAFWGCLREVFDILGEKKDLYAAGEWVPGGFPWLSSAW